MNGVKALVTLRYRPLSDTVIAYVDAIEAEAHDVAKIPDLDLGVVREKLDADTTAEWITVEGVDVLVGVQQMHASVRSFVDGMPPIVAQFVTDLVVLSRDSESTNDPQAALLKTHEMTRKVDISMLKRPPRIEPKRRASRATAKGVEAALHYVLESFEALPEPQAIEQSVAGALRDLAASIGEGEGLSSERTADAAFNRISKSGMRSQQKKTELLALVNDLRDQRTWQSAIDKALNTPDLVLNSEPDGGHTDDD